MSDPSTPRKGLDPVSSYVRWRLERLIGKGAGQVSAKVAAERLGLSESAVSQLRSSTTGLARRHYATYARFLGIRGEPAKAAESLIRDAGEWYSCLMGTTFPLLEEAAVQQAVTIVAQSEGVAAPVVEQILAAFAASRFRDRDVAFWVRTLSEEMRYEAATRRALAASGK